MRPCRTGPRDFPPLPHYLAFFATFAALACAIAAASAFAQLMNTDDQHYFDGAKTIIDSPLPDLIKAMPELDGIEPATSQQDLPAILGKVGVRLQTLAATLPDTTSREDITEQEIAGDGHVEAQRYYSDDFLVLTHRTTAGRANVVMEEYRSDEQKHYVDTTSVNNHFSTTRGFTTSWAHFYPGNLSASNFRLLGEQTLKGQRTYVVAFAQRPGWATVIGSVTARGKTVVILYQGLAWIDATGYQIVRMRTDLLAPRDDIDLEKQTTEIEYGEIHLSGISTPVWLPVDVVVTSGVRTPTLLRKTPKGSIPPKSGYDTVFRNEHHYSDFQIFRVDTNQKPAHPGPTSGNPLPAPGSIPR